jgi:hypothetical protein
VGIPTNPRNRRLTLKDLTRNELWAAASGRMVAHERLENGTPRWQRPRCAQCGQIMDVAYNGIQFCSEQCEYEYNKVGF